MAEQTWTQTVSSHAQTIVVGAVVCVALLVLLMAFVIRRRKRRKSTESLFGSTIKVPPISPSSQHVAIGVQPWMSADQSSFRQSCSVSDLESFGGQPNRKESGLSSEPSSRWGSLVGAAEAETKRELGAWKWKLSFKVQYHLLQKQLELTVFRAKCYPERYSAGLDTDVFVTVFLLPDEERHQTKNYPNTGSPSFDETFTFNVSPSEFGKKQLRLSLYDMDTGRTRICLGHALVRLADLANVEAGGVAYLNKDLDQLATVLDESGPEVHVSLYYDPLPHDPKLKIQIFAARNLPESQEGMTYKLRTTVILGTKTAKKKETEATETLFGVFQCSYAFKISPKYIDTCCLQLKVVGIEHNKQEHVLGSLVIGPCMYAHGSGVDHWKQMLQNTRKTVEMWHRLSAAEVV